MDKTLVRKWLEALRSGKFSQGKGSLRTQLGYCCLGVAAEACFGNTEWDSWETGPYMLDSHTSLNQSDADKLGLREIPLERKTIDTINEHIRAYGITSSPLDSSYTLQSVCMVMNDSYSLGFTQIADMMENVLLGKEAV